jgi:integrase
MRQLRDDTHLILDGEVRVYRRERSGRWQAAFSIDGHTVRVSTGSRTLYSFRHTYATFALLNDGMDIHALAVQMGTSIGMIERHYSHLTPRLKKDMLTGKRYELSSDEFDQKKNGDQGV